MFLGMVEAGGGGSGGNTAHQILTPPFQTSPFLSSHMIYTTKIGGAYSKRPMAVLSGYLQVRRKYVYLLPAHHSNAPHRMPYMTDYACT